MCFRKTSVNCIIISVGGKEAQGCSAQAAIASSVGACVVCSVFFFIIGFLCRHFAHVCYKPSESGSPSEERPTDPLYDHVIPQQQTQEQLELNVNVAYGTAT